MALLAPPRRLLTWTATGLGAAYGGYRVYRRPARTPVAAWSRIGDLTVPAGYTASVVEAQHNAFLDLEAGWAYSGGQWESGWDYFVTVRNATTGLESPVGVPTLTGLTVPPDVQPWVVSNVAPFMSFPIGAFTQLGGNDSTNVVVETAPAGRDRALTRTRIELPYRTFALGWRDFERRGQDGARQWRSAQAAGLTMCLHMQHGDRCIGTLRSLDKFEHGKVGDLTYGAKLVETSGEGDYAEADYNLPAGAMLDGSAAYLTIPSNALLTPGSSAFSIVCAFDSLSYVDGKALLSKGNLNPGNVAYGFRTANGLMRFIAAGASAEATPGDAIANWTTPGTHVAVGTSSGTAQVLYRDGASVAAAATTHGAISNATALVVGANNGGVDGRINTHAQAWAYYARVLTAAEARAASYYLMGYPGYRMPPGAVLFVDLRDARCWNGVSTTPADLTDNGLNATIVGGPPTRGIPTSLLALTDRAG